MPLETDMLTVGALIEKLQGMNANDLPIKLANYDGMPITVYTARKHVVTDEEGAVTDAYVVLNG